MSITKKHLQENEFADIDEYFSYILNSKVNGQFVQARNLIKDLSKQQKKDLIENALGNMVACFQIRSNQYQEWCWIIQATKDLM